MDALFVARVVLRSVERLLAQVTERPIEGRGEFSMGMRTFILDMSSKVLVSGKGFYTLRKPDRGGSCLSLCLSLQSRTRVLRRVTEAIEPQVAMFGFVFQLVQNIPSCSLVLVIG